MDIASRTLEDGRIEITFTGTIEQLEEMIKEDEEVELDSEGIQGASPTEVHALRWKWPKNPFKMKTYCVRCENGTRHTIHARGGAAAALRAATICVPYQLSKGAC